MDNDDSRLKIRKDRPTAISSVVHGSMLDAVGFNLTFIALKNIKAGG